MSPYVAFLIGVFLTIIGMGPPIESLGGVAGAVIVGLGLGFLEWKHNSRFQSSDTTANTGET